MRYRLNEEQIALLDNTEKICSRHRKVWTETIAESMASLFHLRLIEL